ncbi:hypothetical protein MRX96_025822 [Rhipicephalus microplus]
MLCEPHEECKADCHAFSCWPAMFASLHMVAATALRETICAAEEVDRKATRLVAEHQLPCPCVEREQASTKETWHRPMRLHQLKPPADDHQLQKRYAQKKEKKKECCMDRCVDALFSDHVRMLLQDRCRKFQACHAHFAIKNAAVQTNPAKTTTSQCGLEPKKKEKKEFFMDCCVDKLFTDHVRMLLQDSCRNVQAYHAQFALKKAAVQTIPADDRPSEYLLCKANKDGKAGGQPCSARPVVMLCEAHEECKTDCHVRLPTHGRSHSASRSNLRCGGR